MNGDKDIGGWLAALGLERFESVFLAEDIDLRDLQYLSDDDLKELGLGMGPRRRVIAAAQDLANLSRLHSGKAIPGKERSIQQASATSTTVVDTKRGLEAERRQLTVMFVDLVGSTAMTASVDAEEARAVLTRYQNTVAGVVSRHSGYVARYMGDGVLCYFGWPNAGEDDAERAVRAGLETITSVTGILLADLEPLSCRIGIATGLVVVGDLIGSGTSEEAAVVGEAPNLAARLQGFAKPDQVLIAAETRQLLSLGFSVEDLGEHQFKGIQKIARVFRAQGEISVQSRFDARQKGRLPPLVGRGRDLSILNESWEDVQRGNGRAIVVSGEGGIGKSRTVRAFIDGVQDTGRNRVIFQCSSNHGDTAFYPIVQQIRHAAAINATDGSQEQLEKIQEIPWLDNHDHPIISSLLNLDAVCDNDRIDISPVEFRSQVMKTLLRVLHQMARENALLIVFEDVHWIDPTSLDFLNFALDSIDRHSILLLMTARPAFEHDFGGHPGVAYLHLKRLSKTSIEALVRKLSNGKSLPEELLSLIAERTDGVPLFVEELTKSILETGVLTNKDNQLVLNGPIESLSIPITLSDSLMARLDRLGEVKGIAQLAACIGREFDHRLLAKVASIQDTSLDAALKKLVEAEIVYRRGLPPDARYHFRHALIREAAYSSLLKERRRNIHDLILTALEKMPTGEFASEPEVVAHHLYEARRFEEAVKFWVRAANRSIKVGSDQEAIVQLQSALDAMKKFPNTSAHRQMKFDIELLLGGCFHNTNGYGSEVTRAFWDDFRERYVSGGDTSEQVRVLAGVTPTLYSRGMFRRHLEYVDSVSDKFDKEGSYAEKMAFHALRTVPLLLMGRPEEAWNQVKEYLADIQVEELNDAPLIAGGKSFVAPLLYGARALFYLGQPAQAVKLARMCVDLSRASKHSPSICWALQGLFDTRCHWGDKVELETILAEYSKIATSLGLTLRIALSEYHSGVLHIIDTDVSSGVELAWKGLKKWERYGGVFHCSERALLIANLLVSRNAKHYAEPFVDYAEAIQDKCDEKIARSEIFRLRGVMMREEFPDQTESLLRKSLVHARESGENLFALRSACDLLELLPKSTCVRTELEVLLSKFERTIDIPDVKRATSLLAIDSSIPNTHNT